MTGGSVESDRRCRCGERNIAGASFCSACGAVLGDGSVLLGASSTVAEVSSGNGIDRRWMAVAGALFAVVIGWSIWSSESPSSDALAEDGPVTVPVDSTTTTNRPTTTRPTTTLPTTTLPTTTLPTTTSLTSGDAPDPSDASIVTVIGDGGPLLAERTDLRLIVGSMSERPLVLELDTGRVHSVPGRGGLQPLAVSGAWLIGRSNDRLVAVPSDDLAAETIALLPDEQMGYVQLADSTPRTDGRAWVYVYGERLSMTLVDLATGEGIESGPDLGNSFSGQQSAVPGSASVPPLVDPLAGGIYEVDGDDYREVAAGLLVAADDRRALTSSCDERLQCEYAWFDRRTWEPIDLAVPPTGANTTSFVNGTDWLILRSYSGEFPSTLFDVISGRSRKLASDQFDGYGDTQPAVSPDGRWLAVVSGRDLVIIDLETGVERSIDGIDAGYGSLLFTTAEVGYTASTVPVEE